MCRKLKFLSYHCNKIRRGTVMSAHSQLSGACSDSDLPPQIQQMVSQSCRSGIYTILADIGHYNGCNLTSD